MSLFMQSMMINNDKYDVAVFSDTPMSADIFGRMTESGERISIPSSHFFGTERRKK